MFLSHSHTLEGPNQFIKTSPLVFINKGVDNKGVAFIELDKLIHPIRKWQKSFPYSLFICRSAS